MEDKKRLRSMFKKERHNCRKQRVVPQKVKKDTTYDGESNYIDLDPEYPSDDSSSVDTNPEMKPLNLNYENISPNLNSRVNCLNFSRNPFFNHNNLNMDNTHLQNMDIYNRPETLQMLHYKNSVLQSQLKEVFHYLKYFNTTSPCYKGVMVDLDGAIAMLNRGDTIGALAKLNAGFYNASENLIGDQQIDRALLEAIQKMNRQSEAFGKRLEKLEVGLNVVNRRVVHKRKRSDDDEGRCEKRRKQDRDVYVTNDSKGNPMPDVNSKERGGCAVM